MSSLSGVRYHWGWIAVLVLLKKTRLRTLVCRTLLDNFFVFFWTNLDHSACLDPSIWTHCFGPVYFDLSFWGRLFDLSLWIHLFGLIYLDPSICLGSFYLAPSIGTCVFGLVYLDLSVWICILGPFFLDLFNWTNLFGPVSAESV